MNAMTMEGAANRGLTFARFFPSDWRTGCLILNLEEEGLYIRICMFMYDTGDALPDDYGRVSQILRVQPLKLKKVLDSLIEKGKIIRCQGRLINERVIEEFDRVRQETAAKELAVKRRQETIKLRTSQQIEEAKIAAAKAATPQHTHGHTPTLTPQHTPPVSQGVQYGVTTPVNSEKANEINERHPFQAHTEAVYQRLESKDQSLNTPPQEQVASSASGGGYLDSLNGTATDLIAFISKHAFVQPPEAQRMLTTNVKAFGTDAMMEAYSITLANMGGQFISAPYKYLIETARRIKTSGKSQSGNSRGGAANDIAAKRERIRKHAEEAAEAFERQRGRQ